LSRFLLTTLRKNGQWSLMRKLVFLAVIAAFLALFPGHAHGLDTGFRPDRDGFGFANFGDPEGPGGFDLNTLLGTNFHDEFLCHTGHCFGMAQASVENFESGNASILIPTSDAMPYIDRIQTGQSFYYIAGFFRAPLGEKPADNGVEFKKLCARLSAGKPAVLGIYSSCNNGPGHAVVAYRIEQDGEKAFIYIYDPNIPPTLHDYETVPMMAVFDVSDGTFSYDNGRTFDEMKLDDLDDTGIALGRALSAGFVGLPFMAVLLLVRRPRSPRRP
jgi:hypothetical protein